MQFLEQERGDPMSRLSAAGTLACCAALGLALILATATGIIGPATHAIAQSSYPGAPTDITPGAGSPDGQSYLPPPNQPPPPSAQPYPAQQPHASQPYPRQTPQSRTRGSETYSNEEIMSAGHRFFGRVSSGLASVIEHAFHKSGRPNGYILGEEAGGAFIAGLRYGEGSLHTKNAGEHKIFWQGPSIGYDFGAEGSKTMILVYNLQRVEDIYTTFGGVDGSAYFIGGIGITFQKHEHMTLAPIRSGIGFRLGANVGYLKYTRRPTWNPF